MWFSQEYFLLVLSIFVALTNGFPVKETSNLKKENQVQKIGSSLNDGKAAYLQKLQKDLLKAAKFGLLATALKAEQKLEDDMLRLAVDVSAKKGKERYDGIQQLNALFKRDKRAVDSLNNILDPQKATTYDDYRNQLHNVDVRNTASILGAGKPPRYGVPLGQVQTGLPHQPHLGSLFNEVVNTVHGQLPTDIPIDIKHQGNVQKFGTINSKKSFIEILDDISTTPAEETTTVFPTTEEEVITESRIKRQELTTIKPAMAEKQEEANESGSEEEAPGGLAGLIASLSGGGEDGMSDVGALLGAVSGLLGNLLGEGGIDVQALIGTTTSLLGGLLAGDKNIGEVFAGYLNTGLDGFTGGGAIENGNFFGTFLGNFLSQLSANGPEEDPSNGPPDSGKFLTSLLGSFFGSFSGGGMGDAEGHGGSDILGFLGGAVSSVLQIKMAIVKSLIQSVVGLIGGLSNH